jgi:hypothetical protein
LLYIESGYRLLVKEMGFAVERFAERCAGTMIYGQYMSRT